MSSDSDRSDSSGGDTDEIIAAAKTSKPIATKKKKSAPGGRLRKINKKNIASIPDADDDSERGLFDSDSDSDDDSDDQQKKPARTSKKSSNSSMTRREKIELLAKAKRRDAQLSNPSSRKEGEEKEKKGGYESGDSYDSADYVRTKEDDDFIDFEGEDEEARKEYLREQAFDDERHDGQFSEDEGGNRKRKRPKAAKKIKTVSQFDGIDLTDSSNPVAQAINRMKKKKKEAKGREEIQRAAETFLDKMEQAAEEDEIAIKKKKPALKKLTMLPSVLNIMTQKAMVEELLEKDLLGMVKRWIQPLPNGTLGNVTVRQKLIEAVAKIGTTKDVEDRNGVKHECRGIELNHLKESGFGKLLMTLYVHKSETPEIKRKLKEMIEEYSRVVFNRSGNMRDLRDSIPDRRSDAGLAGLARARTAAEAASATQQRNEGSRKRAKGRDLGSMISQGKRNSNASGKSRVSVPYSKGFHFTQQPQDKKGDVSNRNLAMKESRQDLHKRIVERKRKGGSKMASGLSIEGRAAK